MRVLSTATRALTLGLGVAMMAGCRDEIPTVTGPDQFPAALSPTTIELILPATDFLSGGTVFDAFTRPAGVGYLMAADRFDGALTARSLARLAPFPDTVVFTAADATVRTETDFQYVGGRMLATVDAAGSSAPGPVTLRLWAAAEAWDETATWTRAVDLPGNSVLWRTPGGTLAAPLATATWVPGDTATLSLVWAIDGAAVRQMAAPGFPGVIVTAEAPGARIHLTRLALETQIRPASAPDTTLVRFVSGGPQTFVFTPEQPAGAAAFRVGGVGSARTVFQLDLSRGVPGCPNPAQTPDCPRLPLSEVTLNRATLLLDPLPVPQGFRPLRAAQLTARRVVEPALGRQAPLAELLALDSVPAAAFQAPAAAAIPVDLTGSLVFLAGPAQPQVAATIALLVEPEGSTFGTLWFGGSPRLRLVYTLPLRPRLP
jgi:hypothetical protein